MKKKQHKVVPHRTRTNPKMGSAMTRVRLAIWPAELVAVIEGAVDGRRVLLKIREGLIANDEPLAVSKWQLKRRASATGDSVRDYLGDNSGEAPLTVRQEGLVGGEVVAKLTFIDGIVSER